MLFAFRYWLRALNGAVKPYLPVYLVVILLSGLMFWRNIQLEYALLTYFARAGLTAAVILGFLAVLAAIPTALNYRLYNILNCYGFGEEYYNAFCQQRMSAAPDKADNIVQYAELLMKMGCPGEALKYLDRPPLPPNSTGTQLAMRLYVYVMSALKAGDVELAEIEWGKWNGFVSSAPDMPNYHAICFLLSYADIAIDCCAGRLGAAYRKLTDYMHSREYHKYHPDTLDCEILMLAILHRLGWKEQYNELLPKTAAQVEKLCRSKFRPMFASQAVAMREEFNKVQDGYFPF